jgi:hypothetical protein
VILVQTVMYLSHFDDMSADVRYRTEEGGGVKVATVEHGEKPHDAMEAVEANCVECGIFVQKWHFASCEANMRTIAAYLFKPFPIDHVEHMDSCVRHPCMHTIVRSRCSRLDKEQSCFDAYFL